MHHWTGTYLSICKHGICLLEGCLHLIYKDHNTYWDPCISDSGSQLTIATILQTTDLLCELATRNGSPKKGPSTHGWSLLTLFNLFDFWCMSLCGPLVRPFGSNSSYTVWVALIPGCCQFQFSSYSVIPGSCQCQFSSYSGRLCISSGNLEKGVRLCACVMPEDWLDWCIFWMCM